MVYSTCQYTTCSILQVCTFLRGFERMSPAAEHSNAISSSGVLVQRLRITFSSDCAFCDKSTKIGTLVVLYI